MCQSDQESAPVGSTKLQPIDTIGKLAQLVCFENAGGSDGQASQEAVEHRVAVVAVRELVKHSLLNLTNTRQITFEEVEQQTLVVFTDT